MILLDTHVLVRYMCNEGKLGRRALSVIDRAVSSDELFVSAISFWEVATLVAKRRLELDTTVAAFRDLAIRNGAREQVLDGDIATLAGELPDAHGDPADRMLVATAIVRGLTLVTADAVLLEWKLRGFRTRDATE
ncbi:MAG TPA: type II toxin-antitoxin system VapC family toxin [Kofleriaceae bacterium]|nr:type II toxin-antitoxin system VapC family toxin [Kofleriaceae bacterium]